MRIPFGRSDRPAASRRTEAKSLPVAELLTSAGWERDPKLGGPPLEMPPRGSLTEPQRTFWNWARRSQHWNEFTQPPRESYMERMTTVVGLFAPPTKGSLRDQTVEQARELNRISTRWF
jgi:hypothetical protein